MQPKYYIVGGYVRDQLLGVKSKDVDFAVEAESYSAMRQDLISKGVIIYQERENFLVIRGSHPKYGGVDYVLCRSESDYADGRRPNEVKISSLFEDQKRRDFTVNSIAQAEDGTLIDPFGGQEDLKKNRLRCVGDPYVRFSEDYLRIVRAVRFHIVKGFDLQYSIQECFLEKALVSKLAQVSKERIYEELRKCFEHDTKKTLDFFREYSILESVIFGDCGIKLEPKL